MYRILSSYWLAHVYLMKKSAKMLLYSGLDCGMLEFFTHKPQSNDQLLTFPHFWRPIWRKRLRFVTIQPVIPADRRIRCIFVKDQNLKNQKSMEVDVLFQAFPTVPLSCRSNLAGRYLEALYMSYSFLFPSNPIAPCIPVAGLPSFHLVL